MELGIIGLGKMGGNLSLQCVDKGIRVVGTARHSKPELSDKGVKVVKNHDEFANFLTHPRKIYLSLPAGATVDKVLSEIVPHLDKGDVIMDGGNSYYKDSMRREKELAKQGIYFLDCGTSGGLDGARYGACFMVGGRDEGVRIVEPVLKRLAVEGGYIHAGGPGSGHFVKLVHNGIEFGMLQSIGEGVELMRRSNFDLDLQKIFENWIHGSVIRGWLVELMAEGLREVKSLDNVPAYVEDTGEVNWLVEDAVEQEIPIPAITQSVLELFKSRGRADDTYRAIAIMRHGFGGHPYGPGKYIADERKSSRVGSI
ncbi:MAG: decarboxylating 6-phosphogluconate dehydrogenase [Thaumarchaeota archaeon]|nr:decarboxylating 6-phosphogluconate dehydrogenase [Nitrososphaerota archaeon]